MKKLYVIHGWTYTVEPWARTISLLKSEYDIEVEMLHVPGLTTGSKNVWDIEGYKNWADKNIPNGSIALGHSNGGRILLNLCAEKPNKLKHLILLDAAGVYEKSAKRDISRKLSKVFAPLKKSALLRKVFHKLVGASDYDRAPENMKQTLANMLSSDKKLDIKKVKTNTSILWGEKDTVTPLRQAEKMHEMIEGSTLVTYKNWTHAPYIADPAGLARAINKIMETIK
jgi:pimeloyl-ACP methyl ester carboxylesterase